MSATWVSSFVFCGVWIFNSLFSAVSSFVSSWRGVVFFKPMLNQLNGGGIQNDFIFARDNCHVDYYFKQWMRANAQQLFFLSFRSCFQLNFEGRITSNIPNYHRFFVFLSCK